MSDWSDREDVLCAMHAARWYPADPITFRSSLEIVGSVVLNRPYRDAPVSSLFYEGRREDLAFEKPDGKSAIDATMFGFGSSNAG